MKKQFSEIPKKYKIAGGLAGLAILPAVWQLFKAALPTLMSIWTNLTTPSGSGDVTIHGDTFNEGNTYNCSVQDAGDNSENHIVIHCDKPDEQPDEQPENEFSLTFNVQIENLQEVLVEIVQQYRIENLLELISEINTIVEPEEKDTVWVNGVCIEAGTPLFAQPLEPALPPRITTYPGTEQSNPEFPIKKGTENCYRAFIPLSGSRWCHKDDWIL